MSEKILGPLSVIGAAIGYTLASFPHSWGALGSYMISYHAHYTPDLDTSVFEWIYPT